MSEFMHAYGLYTHIRSNKWRSVVLLLGLFFLIYLLIFAVAFADNYWVKGLNYWTLTESLGYSLADLGMAAPWATGATLLWVVIAFHYHQSMIDRMTGGREVTREEQPRLYNLLENLCVSRGLPMPKLKVMESDALNAFTTGMNEKQYAITVTSALLANLDDAELEAVLGHELTHIRNGDVRMMVIAVIVVGIFSFLAEVLFRLLGAGGRGGKNGDGLAVLFAILVGLVMVAIAWLLAQTVRLALSRQREYLADAGSVELTKNPDAMISALRKIEGRGGLHVMTTSAVMEMCVDNPRQGWTDIFDTHPAIGKRIAALIEYAGGRDPGPIASLEPAGTDKSPPSRAPNARPSAPVEQV